MHIENRYVFVEAMKLAIKVMMKCIDANKVEVDCAEKILMPLGKEHFGDQAKEHTVIDPFNSMSDYRVTRIKSS